MTQPDPKTDHEQLMLGDAGMDHMHREFLDLHAWLLQASGQAFADGFAELLTHTRKHFTSEEILMAATAFPATAEHKSDHQRVLGEMDRFAGRIAKGSTQLARAWVNEQLPDWFAVHVRNMDSALAAHLKRA
jgi:hemerythrin